ncbi:AGCS family alanine or glycine:cation symporter [Acetoanaerobium pronyense]|uniref:AGCS family alanine or glycine:cation symporter n=1 Tax=Acetoanaerobium pronyense TaxID=1482736 RepID=A0ABS4KQ86_9FIRM|nr:alanine/glycine:cation symporter family protein [Acetoanaerobium pronyense]MBP2028774.1 AGCS family alanine or glycine:cation symporter [Acetoanaerobium pronyense]
MNVESMVDFLNGIIWSNALIYFCLGAGIFFSVLLKFPQVRLIKDMVGQMLNGESSENGVSSFQGFAMALGGRVGTGNIAGVATAIGFGGPGAVFWMWAIAFLGAGSAYIESALAQVYKEELDGEYRGGPSYYIEKGLGIKWFAVLFAISAVLGVGIFLPGVQANSIASAINTAFGVSPYVTGAVVVVLLAFVVFGGTKRIGKTAEMIVPFMAIAYIIVAVIIVLVNITALPAAFMLIIRSAFGADAAFGAILGIAVQWGVKRGIYSNEAGQGTGPMAAAAAEVSHPAKQGLVQAFSVYVDTLFVCSATAFMIIITGMYNVSDGAGGFIVENLPGVETGPAFTQMAVNTLVPGFGQAFVAVALFFFAFTTLLAYYYYAETNVAYLFKGSKNHKLYFLLTKLGLLAMTYYGSIRTASLAWGLGDIGVGLMAWLNLIAIVMLTKTGVATLRDYEAQKKQGLDPIFVPEDLGIKNAEIWKTIGARYKKKIS